MEKKETTLKRVRSSKGFTQRNLSEATGISLRTIQHWEQGSKDFNQAAAMTVYEVAQALGVDMLDLLDIPEAEETDEKLKGEIMGSIFGYDLEGDKLTINRDEAEIVKLVFEKVKEYTEHPPRELVDTVLEITAEKGEAITYEEAEQRVSYSDILAYLAKELNANEEVIKLLGKRNSDTLVGTLKRENAPTSEPIIPAGLWSEVQEKMKKQ